MRNLYESKPFVPRHTHGTVLAENGVNPKTVMERASWT